MSALLEVRDLAVRFTLPTRGRARGAAVLRAVDGVSLQLARGEALGLVGESGSGKSTIARAIAGLHRPSAGSIRFDGAELGGLAPRARAAFARRIQMVFQDPYGSLDPRHTIGAIVAEPLAIHGIGTRAERRARVAELLEAVGLAPAHALRFPHEFSGGQRQRIAIARALATRPDLVLLDEPTSALDVSIQAQIVDLLADLSKRYGLAYLFISHDLAVVRHLCARVAVLYLGRVVEEAPAGELFGAPRHPYTRALLAAVPEVPAPGAFRPRAEGARRLDDPPSPLALPAGCRYHPRCAERAAVPEGRCERLEPMLLAVETGSMERTRVACHLHGGATELLSSATAPSGVANLSRPRA